MCLPGKGTTPSDAGGPENAGLQIFSPVEGAAYGNDITFLGRCLANNGLVRLDGDVGAPVDVPCPSSGVFQGTVTLSGLDGEKIVSFEQGSNHITVSLTKDTVSPLLNVVSPLEGSSPDTSLPISVSGECENGAGLAVLYGPDVEGPLVVVCIGGWFSFDIVASGGAGARQVTIVASDEAGNETQLVRVFNFTELPIVTIDSPAANTRAQVGLGVSGTCNSSIATVDLAGAGLSVPTTAACSNGAYSATISFTTGDGAKEVSVSQTDPLLRTVEVIRQFVRDTEAPSVSIAAPYENDIVTGDSLVVSGSCDEAYSVNIAYGLDLTGPSVVDCNAGIFNFQVTVNTATANSSVTVSQTDEATNVGSDVVNVRLSVVGTWSQISAINQPISGDYPAVVWTGSKMLVWGGGTPLAVDGYLATDEGRIYDPSSDIWTSMAVAPSAVFKRRLHKAVWTGTEMIVWGGCSGSCHYSYEADAAFGAYEPFSDTWSVWTGPSNISPVSDQGAINHSLVWTGADMIVLGGYYLPSSNPTQLGAVFNRATETWSMIDFGQRMRDHHVMWAAR